MIYLYLRSVNLPATVTNKRSHVSHGLADDQMKQYESGEISRLDLFPKLVTDMSAMFPLRCARTRLRSKGN
jgi:hypothetical protein